MSTKIQSDAAIRRSLSTLNKAGLVKFIGLDGEDFIKDVNTVLLKIPTRLLSPKKSLRKRLPKVKKVEKVNIRNLYN